MTEKEDLMTTADALSNDLDFMHTLLSAARDKTIFYLENRKLLGPYGELLQCCASELENLLSLAGQFLNRMDGEVEAVLEFAYAGGQDGNS